MRDDGGSIRPWDENVRPADGPDGLDIVRHPGMTMRQWYKGQALAGLADDFKKAGHPTLVSIARNCAALADAMIAEDKEFAEKGEVDAKE